MAPRLTVAFGEYEILRALKDGRVKVEGVELEFDTKLGPKDRHWKMAKENYFDICEFNAPAYLMARDRGVKWNALPVFCHRRFRHGFIFVNPRNGITEPKHLIGKKVGGTNFQPAGNIWIRGILEEEYGVPHDSIHWFTERGEDIDFEPHPGLKVTRIREDQDLDQMLMNGELDALIEPEFPEPFMEGDPRMVRLFNDHESVERDYFRRTGIFPIMHVTVIKQEVVDEYPWLPAALKKAFEESKRIAMEKLDNPRIVPLAWWAAAWENQKRILGTDPWEYGLTEKNRKNLQKLIHYTKVQGLISREFSVDEMFLG
jgi:4,5-dihydroxyphthalate decarboxylase